MALWFSWLKGGPAFKLCNLGENWEFFWCYNIVLISPGEQNVDIDMDKQRVYVTSTLSADELLETIKKAGKTCSYVGVAN